MRQLESILAHHPSHAIHPQAFLSRQTSPDAAAYIADPAAKLLFDFFQTKGLPAIKEEDRLEQWYEDWLVYQARHQLYAQLLSPKALSSNGTQLDLLRLTRFLELFAYFSPAHGYSLQVTFLGLFPILMGDNLLLKRQAIAALEAGGLFALGVSEKDHGSDLFGNEFTVNVMPAGNLIASGSKYYIGNSNCAAMISILARRIDQPVNGRVKRPPFVLFALRPKDCESFKNNQKIRTLGVRAAFVGGFEVKDHDLPETDLIAQGRDAWDAVFGTVTLGKFFLGFGSIGICERAMEEAAAHMRRRILFGKPVIEMPHIAFASAQAYARLAAMKLYAYRALDYVHAATDADRRYLLFMAVQKAKVSTEGVKVMALLSECIGAKGFESDTYFEMALRDAQLIPGLEGSTHINLAAAAQYIPRYFAKAGDASLKPPASLAAGEIAPGENPYLMEARAGAVHSVTFPGYLHAYKPLAAIPNVRRFARQAKAFALLMRGGRHKRYTEAGSETSLAMGHCLATIAFGQLIAENAAHQNIAPQMISAIFHLLVADLTASAITLASLPRLSPAGRALVHRMIIVPRATVADWEFVSKRIAAFGDQSDP
jgi:acyl-CoA dehydrogenase